MVTDKKVDVTKWNYLVLDYNVVSGGDNSGRNGFIALCNYKSGWCQSYGWIKQLYGSSTVGRKIIKIDISTLKSSYYVIVGAGTGYRNISQVLKVNKFYMTK